MASAKVNRKFPSVRRRADDGLVQKVLKLCEVMHIWAWRINSGMVTTESGSKVRLSPPGTPDVIAIIHGRACFIECKKRGGKLNANQVAWAKRAEEEGAQFASVDSLGDAKFYLTKWEAGDWF